MNDELYSPPLKALPPLSTGEFIIIQDDSCHLVTGSESQVTLTPSNLFLTNLKLIIEPIFDSVEPCAIPLSSITNCNQKDINDCPILNISYSPNGLIRIFIPDNDQQIVVARLLARLCAASEIGQADCDKISKAIHNQILNFGSLQKFYKAYKDLKIDFDRESTKTELLTKINPAPVDFFDVLSNIIQTSELLMFSIIITLVLMIALVFSFIPFGVFFFGFIFIVVTRYGLMMVFNEDFEPFIGSDFDAKMKKEFRTFIRAYETFMHSFQNRFLWNNPRHTLEVVMFLLASTLLFTAYDPAAVLAFSSIGLAFVERWNPFGFGSLFELFTALVQFE
ncbi:hypothetical protein TRFO_07245 [Tritrichomonas foetus]|uniref:Uncharacterized protein n=1 Tax=Tritrichomonas foetus TaxID=1144522 RepID=A0A1J4JUB9_9EUKA|nr:hypothetical protein TRFO_07245 [Tritrichomonas foetus]|eukprot:OHT02072.1 hypothetical protein TRFO_07245 [Tritrichomonas foetus]